MKLVFRGIVERQDVEGISWKDAITIVRYVLDQWVNPAVDDADCFEADLVCSFDGLCILLEKVLAEDRSVVLREDN